MHPWDWLNDSQHAASLQAIFAGLGWMAAVLAAIYARGAYVATLRQLSLTQAQYANTTMPHLKVMVPAPAQVERFGESEILRVTVRNVGSGAAMDIEGSDGILARATTLPANADFQSSVTLSKKHVLGKRSQTVFLRYRSVDGRRFRTEVTIAGGEVFHESFADISNGVEPASLEDALRQQV